MESNGFRRAGSLEEPMNVNDTFLKPAGSLEEPMNVNDTFLKPAGDLENFKSNNSFNFEEKKESLKTPDEIREWLKTIVSGEKKSNYAFGEGIMATGGGNMFVTIDKLKEMLENGDNVIKAEYFENMNLVLVEYESFGLNNNSKRR